MATSLTSSRTAPTPGDVGASAAEATEQIVLPDGEQVWVRRYGQRQSWEQGQPLVLHFHGGTFNCGDLDSGRNVAVLLAKAGAVVVSLDYPLAPEHPFPKPVEVGYGMLAWLHRNRVKLAGKGARLFVAGEAAGGNLAAALALVARDRGEPPMSGQVLLSPMLDPCAGTASLREFACGSTDQCKWANGWQEYLGEPCDALHPYAVPGASLRLTRLAPTLVLVGPQDPLRDEALHFTERLRASGVEVLSHVVGTARDWPEALYDADVQGCAACEVSVVRYLREFFLKPTLPPPAPRGVAA